jgi:hypothetical protein
MVDKEKGPECDAARQCPECGKPLVTSSGPGRTFTLCRVTTKLPDDLVYDECPSCGATWMGSKTLFQLDALMKAEHGSDVFYGDVPDNWQVLHRCSSFKLEEDGRCFFCHSNGPDGKFAKEGFEVIPFDVPGVYDPRGEPNVMIRKRPKS